MLRPRSKLLAFAVGALLVVAGCDDEDDSGPARSDPEDAALAFVRSAVSGESAAACELAKPGFLGCEKAAEQIAAHYDVETLFAGGRDEIGDRKALIQIPLVEANGTTGKVARIELRERGESWLVHSAGVDTPRGVE